MNHIVAFEGSFDISRIAREQGKRVNRLRGFCRSELANNELVNIVFNPLDEFLDLQEVSYRQLTYAKDLVSEMEAWAKRKEASPILKSFLTILVYMNFNAINVATFLMWEIANSINAFPEQNKKVERLADYLKQCNQTHIEPSVLSGLIFFPSKNKYATG